MADHLDINFLCECLDPYLGAQVGPPRCERCRGLIKPRCNQCKEEIIPSKTLIADIQVHDEETQSERLALDDSPIKYEGKLYCRRCAHNLTHLYHLQENEIPCPVFDGETGELIPYGTYPNIDWS